tara:strand:+ start:2104 stop:2502 length:399 start_codon:yes stop_codon:yes gene_type:complete
MVVPVAAAAGKKAADNPAGTLFLAVLAGVVLLQGVKRLPNLGEWAWNRVVPFDVTAPVDITYKAIKTTAALNEEVYEGFEEISAKGDDPFETFIFGDDVEVYGPGEIGTIQKAYQGGRTGLFTGLFNRGWNY